MKPQMPDLSGFVNIHGARLDRMSPNLRHRPATRKTIDPSTEKKHLGFIVVGFSPDHVEHLQQQHEAAQRRLQQEKPGHGLDRFNPEAAMNATPPQTRAQQAIRDSRCCQHLRRPGAARRLATGGRF